MLLILTDVGADLAVDVDVVVVVVLVLEVELTGPITYCFTGSYVVPRNRVVAPPAPAATSLLLLVYNMLNTYIVVLRRC
jgi:hypothetical protein